MNDPRSLPRRAKRRRTRSPLSLWLVLSSAACAAAAAVTSSPVLTKAASINPALEPRLGPRTAEMAPVDTRVRLADYGTTVAFPTGVLGLEEVGAELGHVARHPALNRTDPTDPVEKGEDVRRLEGLHVQRDKRQATSATSATSAVATQSSSSSVAQSESAALTSSSIPPSSTTSTAAASSSMSGSATESASAPTTTTSGVPPDYQLPQPFDSTLGTNFSSTACPSFFATFLADPAFQACAPFSLLLTTSTGFFQAEKQPTTLLPYVLNASCSASLDTCSGLMDSLALKIKLQNTCARDLALGNPLVTEALDGFRSYRLMRQAGCLLSNTTGQYCFAEAAAKDDPSDLYFYYLPEGTTLPSGTTPDCDSCTQNLMGIYASYATNTTLPISKTYSSGRAAVALSCGPTFAPVVTAVTSTSAARSMRLRLDGIGMSVAAAAVVWMPVASTAVLALPFLMRLS